MANGHALKARLGYERARLAKLQHYDMSFCQTLSATITGVVAQVERLAVCDLIVTSS